MSEVFDLVVIGSGPGGYVCAIRAAQLGLKTAVIEKEETFGGTCLNVGCIPSKALLESSEHFLNANHELESHGVNVSNVTLDLSKMMARKQKIVKDLTGGVGYLFKKNKITTFKGTGSFVTPTKIKVGDQTVEAKKVVIATGSSVNQIPSLPVDNKIVVDSTGALELAEVPKHLLVVGAGYIGLELGSVWMRLGAKVTVIEYADHICGAMDLQISSKLQQILKKQGMEFILNAKVESAEVHQQGAKVRFSTGGETKELEADVVLVSAGRKPNTSGLNAESIGLKLEPRGQIEVNEHYQTSVENVFAIGDVIKGPMLAHKAEEEGVAVAEFMVTGVGHVNYGTVPGVIYTWPEVASVGQTEEQLKESGIEYNMGSFPFVANGRAKTMASTDGLVKILADKKTDRVLGVHILGPRASDMIAEAVIAMEFSASSEDIARSFHAHPTLAEAVREAALAVDKRARQI